MTLVGMPGAKAIEVIVIGEGFFEYSKVASSPFLFGVRNSAESNSFIRRFLEAGIAKVILLVYIHSYVKLKLAKPKVIK